MMMVQCILSRGQAVLQCVQSRRGQIYGWDSGPILRVQYHNVFYRKEDKSMVRTVTLIFHTSIISTSTMCSIKESVPIDRAMAQCYLYI